MNYPGPTYTATLPAGGSPHGSVSLTAAPNGIGALVQVSFNGFPSFGGPFCMLPPFVEYEARVNV
jgi:hypothetical protein